MARNQRQNKIIELVQQNDVDTQDALCELLRAEGYAVTQATVCRDIKEIGLIKVNTESKRSKYSYVEEKQSNIATKLYSLFKDSVVSVRSAGHIVVVKTLTGSANTAASFIDKLDLGAIVGCVAGDDTLFLAVDHMENVPQIIDTLNKYRS